MGTYDPQDAYNLITPQLANVTLDSTAKGHLADVAHRFLWNAFPWRWERKILPDITVVDNTQDYTAGVPSDFMGLLQAEMVQTDVTPNRVRPLDVVNFIYADKTEKVAFDQHRQIAYLQELNSGAGGFRIANPSITGSITAVVRGVYRKTPATTYTSANLTTDFTELPDQFFNLYYEVLLYHALRYIGDPRTGGVSLTSGGRAVYGGQYAVMRDAIELASMAEDVPDTQSIFPEESLGPVSQASHSIFP